MDAGTIIRAERSRRANSADSGDSGDSGTKAMGERTAANSGTKAIANDNTPMPLLSNI